MSIRHIAAAMLVIVAASSACAQQKIPGRDAGASVAFIDNRKGVVDGADTYDPTTRTCGGGKDKVFTGLDSVDKALAQADVLYLREGTYSRDSVGPGITIHGNRINYWTGSLAVGVSGTAEKRKKVCAYPGETIVIQAKPGFSGYNPDPGDTSFRKSSHFYPHPAVSVGGNFVDVSGLKTYGQVVISGHDVTLSDCDLGGGGPHMNQGQVVAINSNRKGGTYNVIVRNNRIHHSCWGESANNGSALMGYNFSCIIEHNEFTDNYGSDIRIKDAGSQQGRETDIRYNFFGPSRLRSNEGTGGLNQDKEIDRILVHHNVFLGKRIGAVVDGNPPGEPPDKGMFIYNNTFVNCTVDVGGWTTARINVHNNLFYNAKPAQHFYDIQVKDWKRLDADYNLFFSTAGDTSWKNLYRDRGTDLATWQKYSGRDAHSVWKDPGFVKPDGSRPEDFKRKTMPAKDVAAGGPHGTSCGAYVTGDEIIGLLPKEAPEKTR